ncbi:cupin domain-containing protein [Kitasatospora sp. MBT63]|uniref:cupin domain-containing protein n=1 Tax=Kitasatospora sp. MBT63 TaxID=1444768 RepID=UPI0007C7E226|nr:cupin domain-containing protein [Kitasatospora sp. MBT63]
MRTAVIVADTRDPVAVHGVHGTSGLTQWACLARRAGLGGGWEAVEWARIPRGGVSGEHLHTRTEEVYVLLAGHGEITLDGHPHPVRAGDAVLTRVGTRHGLRNLGRQALEWLVIEVTAPLLPSPRTPLLDHSLVTNLRRLGRIDPTVVLSGPLRLLETVRLRPGERVTLTADVVERTLFVSAGSGRAATAGLRVPLRPGRALTLPLGSSAALTAGRGGLEYVHAELAVPDGHGPLPGPVPAAGGERP